MTTDPISRLNSALEGRYRIERELGEGGMATVYLAEDLRHERKVALKVLKPELAAVVGGERFLTEIKTTANLKHPHILPLHDSGEADGFLFFVMPYLEGESLQDRIDRDKQLPVDEAVEIARKVAAALQHAHEHGVVHRDIKPGNILFQDNEPVVTDFGIALAAGVAGGTRLTETGLSVGTPFYMSPEQATGDQDVGPATDTYALGCVLYEMLVGEPPYLGNTAQAVLGKIIQGLPVSATAARRSVPGNVDAAIRKALEKLPADRFTSARDFGDALGLPGFRHGQEVLSGVPTSMGAWKVFAMVASALALFFGMTTAWSLLRPEPPQVVSRQVLGTEGWAGLAAEFGRYAAVAPDGSSVILPVGNQLALKMRASTEITPIPGTEAGRDVVYSPNAQWIAYAVGGELYKRPLVGGSPVRLAEDVPTSAGVVGLSWMDDGTILYEQDRTGATRVRRVVRISEDGGEPLDLVFGVDEEVAVTWVHGLPDARGALVVSCPGTICLAENSQLHLVNLEDLSSEVLFDQVLRAWYAATGHIVYVRTDGAVFAQPFDLAELEPTGSTIPLFEGVSTTSGNNSAYAHMHLGADGTLLYVAGSGAAAAGGGQRLVLVSLDGDEEPLVLTPRTIAEVRWSPDGQSVVYASEGHIYTYNVALGTTPRQLTFEGTNVRPVFSSDGSRVAFASTRGGTQGFDLFVKTLEDDAPPRSIITLEGGDFPTQWPADTLIVFERIAGGVGDLWMLDLSDADSATADVYLPLEADLDDMVISRDGTLAAYVSGETGAEEVYIRSFPNPGAPTLVSESGGDNPFWSPDGNAVYYWRSLGSGDVFMAARLQREPTPAVLARDSLFTGDYLRDFSDLHPDGDRLIVPQNVSAVTDPVAIDSEQPRLILVQNFFEELRQVVPE